MLIIHNAMQNMTSSTAPMVRSDAFQSVMNALMRLDYFIKNSEEFSALDLKWIGASCPGDL
jgi:hypothetical protein